MLRIEQFHVNQDMLAKPRFRLFWCCDGDRSQARDYLLSELGEQDQTKVISRLGRIEQHGLPGNREQYRKLHGYENLHELKCGHVRVLFFVLGDAIILTTAFWKSKGETPKQQTDRADRIRREYLAALG